MIYQDWIPVVLTKNKQKINTQTKQNKPEIIEDDIPKLNKITKEYSLAIINGRNALNLTQKQLAQKLCIKDNIIKEYENGNVINFNLKLYKIILKNLNIDPKTVIIK
jgi:ribosome-binding protein aMBF1 (putative translation factor)